ncbi:unnamed protein product [Sphagnum troendelagicum]|uniref:Uncharacterized protein n=1 Tax=Sphagnum troendelagicum TaxID=128251 RepID=A0ABP0UTY5_9BRYO
MRKVSIKKAAEEFESLSEEERRALRISRFHAMPVLSSSSASSSQHSQPRLAHPGGPLATNKAVALGKFLKRKLSEPGGATSLDPALVEQAVNNAKATVEAGKGQLLKSGVKVLHVDSFSGSDKEDDQLEKTQKPAKIRKKKKFNKQIANQQIKQDNGMKKKGKKNKMPKKFKF